MCREAERVRTRIIKWPRRRAGPPLHYNVLIYIYMLPTDRSMQPRRQVYGAYDRLYVRGVRGKKNLTETHPLPSLITVVVHTILQQHHSPPLTRLTAFTLLNFYTEVNEQNENCVHTVYGILCLCVFVYVLCIRSPRTGRLASGVLMKGVVVV